MQATSITAVFAIYIALLWSLAVTPWVRELARRCGVVDHPDGHRKTHGSSKPLGGGVAILLATVFGVLTTAWFLRQGQTAEIGEWLRQLAPLFAAATVIVVVGLLDDRFALRGRQKLAGQLLAASIVIAAGLRIPNMAILGWQIDLGSLSIPFTLFWVLGAINALNLLDGADGFATCIGIVIAATLGVIAFFMEQPQDAILAFALTGALIGFLAFNFPPASIFLGDAGSMLIGLVLGVLAIQGHLKSPATFVLATPVALLLIPIIDSSAAVLRRWLGGKKLSTADRHHLHHLLQRQGFGPRGMLIVVTLLCCLAAGGALLTVIKGNQIYAVLSVIAVMGVLWGNDMFGNTELTLVGSRLNVLAGSMLPTPLHPRRAARQLRIGLRDAPGIRQMWRSLREFADENQLSTVRLELDPAHTCAEPMIWEHRRRVDGPETWQTRIPLSAASDRLGNIEFAGPLSGDQARELLDPLGRLVGSLEPYLVDLLEQRSATLQYEQATQASEQPETVFPQMIVFDQADIAGIKFDFVPVGYVIKAIEHWRHEGRRSFITLTNPHSVMLCRRDSAMRDATSRAGLTLPDGVGVLLGAKLLGYGRRHRVAGPTLMLELCDKGRLFGYRHFFYGGQEGIADKLAETLSERFPGLEVAGTYCPPFREITDEEDERIVEMINSSRADIVWVGLGTPKQEKWMGAHAMCIDATAMIGVGAAFDFHTGNVKWAPWIFRRTGTEWAYRLAMEPRRMWRRNLDSPLFMYRVARQWLRRWRRMLAGKPSHWRIRSVTWDTSELSLIEKKEVSSEKRVEMSR